MLTLVSAAIAFGVLGGLVVWQANVATFSDYHTIVDEASVSVDAALHARAAALDHMSAAATYLETTGQDQQAALARANDSWNTFNEQARISWRNITDRTQGEENVFTAADAAATDYIQQIGAMFSYRQAGQTDQARASFLAARQTMNTRLVPALGGLESVKVEKMEATYAGADARITRWRDATLWIGGLVVLLLLVMLWAIRRMHYRWSWPIGAAIIVAVLLTAGVHTQLDRAASDAQVLVREAYDNIAGVQDLAALLSQERALDSILVFDPQGTAGHLADFDQYNTLVEQRLCGPRDCTKNTFLDSDDRVSASVVKAARDEQSKLGLPRTPLVANVYFGGQANEYERLRQVYRTWLAAHDKIASQVGANQLPAAAATSTGESAQAFTDLKANTDTATGIARNQFDDIWRRNYTLSKLFQGLAILFPIGAILAAWGLWQRRTELRA